jgi:hypothetical protein
MLAKAAVIAPSFILFIKVFLKLALLTMSQKVLKLKAPSLVVKLKTSTLKSGNRTNIKIAANIERIVRKSTGSLNMIMRLLIFVFRFIFASNCLSPFLKIF